eukprot:352430-Chlamydomonas_euryale.AAC.1
MPAGEVALTPGDSVGDAAAPEPRCEHCCSSSTSSSAGVAASTSDAKPVSPDSSAAAAGSADGGCADVGCIASCGAAADAHMASSTWSASGERRQCRLGVHVLSLCVSLCFAGNDVLREPLDHEGGACKGAAGMHVSLFKAMKAGV